MTSFDDLQIRPNLTSDWKYCPEDAKGLCEYIVNNDRDGLRQHIRYQRTQSATDVIQKQLDGALQYAAALGDDVDIQVLVQEGAKVTTDIVNLAAKKQEDLPGVGGHAFAAMYLEALKDGLVSPFTPLTKLMFSPKSK